MKKIVAVILCAVMAVSLPITAFAVECPFNSEGTSTLKYKAYSSCTVTIPETIEIYNDEQSADIVVTNPNVEDGYVVNVYVKNLNSHNCVELTHDASGEAVAEVSFTNKSTNANIDSYNPLLASIECSDNMSETFYASFGVSVVGSGYRAGNYTGTMQYDVRIEQKA